MRWLTFQRVMGSEPAYCTHDCMIAGSEPAYCAHAYCTQGVLPCKLREVTASQLDLSSLVPLCVAD